VIGTVPASRHNPAPAEGSLNIGILIAAVLAGALLGLLPLQLMRRRAR
jgi:hypothetical protein